MCPISLEELRSMAPAVPIGDDRPCSRCGYNLKGLTSNDRCPECGTPAKRRSQPVRQSGMIEAEPQYVLTVLLGMCFVLTAGAGMVLVAVVAGTGIDASLHAMGLLGAIWTFGVCRVTTPRQADDVRAGDHAAVRWTLRAAAAGFIVSGAAATWFLMSGLGGGGHIFVRLGVLGALAGVVSVAGLMLWCAKLAEWANDDSVARTLRYNALAVPFAFVFALIGLWIGSFLGLWAGGNAEVIGAWVGGTVPIVLVAWALVRFLRLVDWSRKNAAAIKAKDDRLRERARIAAKTGQDPGFAPIGKRLCRACGYDLAGIIRSPVCPECGESIE